MKLFAIGNGSVSDYLRSNISSLKDKIASYTDEQIMNSDFDEWVEYLTKKYQVEPITFFVNATTRSLHETTIQQYNPWSRMGSAYGEPEYYNLDGYNIDFKIPFVGDSILLKCQPSTYTFTSYEIVDFQRSTESSYGYITIRLSYTNQEIKSLRIGVAFFSACNSFRVLIAALICFVKTSYFSSSGLAASRYDVSKMITSAVVVLSLRLW